MYEKTPAPDGDRNFNRRWTSPFRPSTAEIELTKLRQIHGNAAGARIFRKQVQRDQVRV